MINLSNEPNCEEFEDDEGGPLMPEDYFYLHVGGYGD
jgi:hypothetical protein